MILPPGAPRWFQKADNMFDFFSRFTSSSKPEPAEDKMVALVEKMARALVEDPDSVKAEAVETDTTTAIELRVAPGDLGRIIGRKGRMAGAIRAILSAAGTRSGKKYLLEILE